MEDSKLKEKSSLSLGRRFNSPPEKVWRAWTDPQALKSWLFSLMMFKSHTHCDRVNAKVMKAPRQADMVDPKSMPFELKRMTCGRFRILVEM